MQKMNLTDRILSVTAIIAAIAAVVVAVYEARIMRDYQQISVWPSLQIFSSSDYARPAFFYEIVNRGLGPAIVEDMHLFLDGEEQPDWQSLLADLSEGEIDFISIVEAGSASLSTIPAGTTILPGDNIRPMVIFSEEYRSKVEIMFANMQRVDIELCYCSVYGECWRTTLVDNQSYRVPVCRPEDAGQG